MLAVGELAHARPGLCVPERAGVDARAAGATESDDEGQLRTDQEMRPPLLDRARGSRRPRLCSGTEAAMP